VNVLVNVPKAVYVEGKHKEDEIEERRAER
jgi:hypothetical protein